MQNVRIIFYGSSVHSLPSLEALSSWHHPEYAVELVGIVTQPPRHVGRKKILTPTPVEVWGTAHHIPVLSFPSDMKIPYLFEHEAQVTDTLAPLRGDLHVVCYFGQKVPTDVYTKARFGGLNIHPSLLPRWRGADPIPWAILSGDHEVGVTLLTLSDELDEGKIVAQKKVHLLPTDMTEPLYTKLFTEGAALLSENLSAYLSGSLEMKPQGVSPTPYARRLTRQDGFEPWETLILAMKDGTDAERIDRKFRALSPWPGLWTLIRVNGHEKRLKILGQSWDGKRFVIQKVQLEGKNPMSFEEFSQAYPDAM